MKKIISVFTTFLLGFLSISLNAKPPIKYHRSHWRIFGNYERVTVLIVNNGDYQRISVNCTGRGDVQCKKYGDCIIGGSEDYDQSEIGYFENQIIPEVDERVLSGQLNGNCIFQMVTPTISSQILRYRVTWSSELNGEMEVTINPI